MWKNHYETSQLKTLQDPAIHTQTKSSFLYCGPQDPPWFADLSHFTLHLPLLQPHEPSFCFWNTPSSFCTQGSWTCYHPCLKCSPRIFYWLVPLIHFCSNVIYSESPYLTTLPKIEPLSLPTIIFYFLILLYFSSWHLSPAVIVCLFVRLFNFCLYH